MVRRLFAVLGLVLAASFASACGEEKCDVPADCSEVTCSCPGRTVRARVCDVRNHKCISDCSIICRLKQGGEAPPASE